MSEEKKDGQGGGPPRTDAKDDKPRRRGGRPRRRRKKKPEEASGASGAQGSQGGQNARREQPPQRSGGQEKSTERGPGASSPSKRHSGDGERGGRDSRRRRGGREQRATSELTRRHDPEKRAGTSEADKETKWGSVENDRAPEGDFQTMSADDIDFLKPHEADEEVLLEDMPETDFKLEGELRDVVGVKLHTSGPVADYDCQEMILAQGDVVIVETGRGLALGEVLVPTTRRVIKNEEVFRVIRKATQNDMRQRERNLQKEEQALRLCQDSIKQLRLDMKLINVDYLHGGNKAVFYFSADGRVDFRELVRELARRLHIRVEMRQIGVRDASRMLGGLGACGLRLCCNRYIREFAPVSIRMAKDQDLVLNPEKVSGLCGRLMCCLAYENAAYKHASMDMPKVGRRVMTPKGEGRIKDRDVLKRMVRVQIVEEPGLHEFSVEEIQPAGNPDSGGRNQGNPSESSDRER